MRRLAWLFFPMLLVACETGGLPQGFGSSSGTGPQVMWDLTVDGLPEIPLPNDFATWPDPTSPTGLRINASLIAPTEMEEELRAHFDALDGFGTYAPIAVRFDEALDTDELLRRQGRGRFGGDAWAEHAIYLVHLETGVPVPLDMNSGSIPGSVINPNAYYENDAHRGESNLLFETVEEDVNGNGVLDPGEDTDWDGVLDHPNTLDGQLTGEPFELYDRLLWFYERESDTLMIRPLLPLEEASEYAVVLTKRLVGVDGQPARSPFADAHHIVQAPRVASLPTIFSERPDLYGDLATEGWDGVAFAWTFTTQSVTGDLDALREGLYGRGPFARLEEEFPPNLTLAPLRGGNRCTEAQLMAGQDRLYRLTPLELKNALEAIGLEDLPLAAGAGSGQIDAVLDSLVDNVEYLVIGYFDSPYLLGDPDDEQVDDVWHLDRQLGEAQVSRDRVPMVITIPKETAVYQQPFPVILYAHGLGSMNLESIAFSGLTARHGVATVSIDAQGHGLPLPGGIETLIGGLLADQCLVPFGKAIGIDRARDLNGDGNKDSAGLYFSAYMFHTRDALRQSALDWLQATRIVRSFMGHPDFPDGRPWEPGTVELSRGSPLEFDGDVDGDGEVDLAGDFDGDGVPDLGGWDNDYYQWGSSLGAIHSMIMLGIEPSIIAGAPVSGGGGLFDIGLRTELGTARNPVWLRVMGPLIVGSPSGGVGDDSGCVEGERSLRFEIPDLSDHRRLEFACVDASVLDAGDAVIVRNIGNGEVRCAGAGDDGRFRVSMPADRGNGMSIEIYEGGLMALDASDCTLAGDPAPSHVVDEWGVTTGRPAPGRCRTCGNYQGQRWSLGEPLVTPVEGLGLARQSPDLRRLATLAQIALDPADPINYARRVFLDPVTASDARVHPRSVLVLNTAGDTVVPPAAGNAYARAAGILAFLPPDAPDDFADFRAPPSFVGRYPEAWATPNDVLIDRHVIEGISDLERHPVPGGARYIFDVDDMSEGLQRFDERGARQVAPDEEGAVPLRLDPPLRWTRNSTPAVAGVDVFSATARGPISGVLNGMIVPRGNHVVLPTDPTKSFDEGAYFINMIGWYLASGGRELLYQSDPAGHHCLATSDCVYSGPRP